MALRDGLDLVTETLGAVHALDGQVRLLLECGPSGPAADLLDGMAAERAALVATLPDALDPETDAALAFLASGREPAPLRAAAPVGDPALPAAVLLPPMLHRRWRRLVKETPVQDLVSMHRRKAELLVVTEVATRLDTPVIGLWPAADALRTAAAAALRVVAANELKDPLPACSTRRDLALIVKRRVWVTREVEKALATVAALGHLLPADDQGPPKVAGGGLVVRPGAAGPEVLLVHRVRHDDWSIPRAPPHPARPCRSARCARCARRPACGAGSGRRSTAWCTATATTEPSTSGPGRRHDHRAPRAADRARRPDRGREVHGGRAQLAVRPGVFRDMNRLLDNRSVPEPVRPSPRPRLAVAG